MGAHDARSGATLLLLSRAGMGEGEAGLRLRLMGTYLRLLLEDGELPMAIAFYTEGVRLVVEGSPVLEPLGELERRGVALIICQTCLDHYGLREQVQVGVIGGMGDILAAQGKAARVVSL